MKRAFRFLWLGQSFANIADLFYIVGLISMIYARTGSATTMAVLPLTITISSFASGLLVPLFMDRFSLRKLLIYSQLGKTVFLLIMVIFISNFSLIFLFGLVMMISFLDGMATPAQNSMVPMLIERDGLVKANSFLSIIDETIRLGGWAVGGIIVALIGATHIIWLTFILFVLSTIMMSLIRVEEPKKEKEIGIKPWDSLREGWVLLWSNKTLKVITFNVVLESMAYVVWIAAIIYVYVEQVLHAEAAWWGYINAAFMLGLLMGGFLMLKSISKFESRKHMYLIIGSLTVCISTFVFGLVSLPWLALFLSFVFGVAEQVKGISMQTIKQQSVEIHLLPKVFSAYGALNSLCFGLASLIMGVIADMYGVRIVFMISAGLLLISFTVIRLNLAYLTKTSANNAEIM